MKAVYNPGDIWSSLGILPCLKRQAEAAKVGPLQAVRETQANKARSNDPPGRTNDWFIFLRFSTLVNSEGMNPIPIMWRRI
jgi:hypothetical protein